MHANMSVLCVPCTWSYMPDSVKNEFDVFRTFGRHPQALRLLSYVFAEFVLRLFESEQNNTPYQSVVACN
jgi:hypothetical protein